MKIEKRIAKSIQEAKYFGGAYRVYGNTDHNNVYLIGVPLNLVKCNEITVLKLINYLSKIYHSHVIDWSMLFPLPELESYDPKCPLMSLNTDTYDDYYLVKLSAYHTTEWDVWPQIEEEILNVGITQEIIRPLISGNEQQLFPSLYDSSDCYDFYYNKNEFNSNKNFLFNKNKKYITEFCLPAGTETFFLDFGEMINYQQETNIFARSTYYIIDSKIYLNDVISFYKPNLELINKNLDTYGFKKFKSIHDWILSWSEIQNHQADFFYNNLPFDTLVNKSKSGLEIYYHPMTNRLLYTKNKKVLRLINPNLEKENLLSLDENANNEKRFKCITLTNWFESKQFE